MLKLCSHPANLQIRFFLERTIFFTQVVYAFIPLTVIYFKNNRLIHHKDKPAAI